MQNVSIILITANKWIATVGVKTVGLILNIYDDKKENFLFLLPVTDGDRCTELNKPCPGLAYSTCIQGLCKCAAGYYHDRNLNNGICLAELGETAESKEFCGYLERYDETTKRCLCARNRFYGADLRSCWKGNN